LLAPIYLLSFDGRERIDQTVPSKHVRKAARAKQRRRRGLTGWCEGRECSEQRYQLSLLLVLLPLSDNQRGSAALNGFLPSSRFYVCICVRVGRRERELVAMCCIG